MTSELLENVMKAHGELANWQGVGSVTAEIVLGGPFWIMRGWPEAELKLTVSLVAHREHITMAPFPALNQLSVFDVDPEQLSIRTTDGQVIDERNAPRSSFPSFDVQTTKWDPIQIAYFTSAACWNYFTQPFGFTYPGVTVHEIQPWQETDETWRRLAVKFPASNANHNPDQVFYYDTNFMMRRMDYAPDVTDNAPVAHYTHNPKTFDGFVFPTRRRIHLRGPDGIAEQGFALITLDVSSVSVE
ncbi:MAG: hypothetical protein ACRDU4_06200, partial [Mycobacterium sp.]